MSIVSNSIINADAEARYLSPGELDQIKSFVTGGQRRLRVAQVLSESRERIVKTAGGQLFQKRPDVISPGGNAYGEEMTATCLRDMDYYLRLVTYGVVAGDVTPIEDRLRRRRGWFLLRLRDWLPRLNQRNHHLSTSLL